MLSSAKTGHRILPTCVIVPVPMPETVDLYGLGSIRSERKGVMVLEVAESTTIGVASESQVSETVLDALRAMHILKCCLSNSFRKREQSSRLSAHTREDWLHHCRGLLQKSKIKFIKENPFCRMKISSVHCMYTSGGFRKRRKKLMIAQKESSEGKSSRDMIKTFFKYKR